MTEQTLYRIAIRDHDRIQKAKGDFYLSEEGVNAELESVRNFKGNVVHLDVYQADSPDLPKRAVDWLRERDLPVTYVAFLRANPQAHMRAILVETRRCLHHSSAKMEKERAQLRKKHQPNLRTRPDPQIEGRILALEGQLAWMRGEIKELTAQIESD